MEPIDTGQWSASWQLGARRNQPSTALWQVGKIQRVMALILTEAPEWLVYATSIGNVRAGHGQLVARRSGARRRWHPIIRSAPCYPDRLGR